MHSRELILAKLVVDQRSRMFIPKDVSELLDILPGDELVLSHVVGKDSYMITVQRKNDIARKWALFSVDC